MANDFSDLLGRIASPFYEGRDLDEEERRRIEELRAQGVYVPQERRIAPFGYGSGRRRREDLTAIRGAIQPEHKRRMDEYLAQAGEQERQRMARENRTRAMGLAVEDQARLDELKRKQGQPWTPDSGQGFEEHLRSRIAKPSLTRPEAAELTVRQRGLLPYRQQEATATKLEQEVEAGALKLPTTVAQEKDKQETLALTAKIRKLLPPEYATIMARNTLKGAELDSKILEAKLQVENSPAGQAIRQQVADNQLAQSMIDELTIAQFNRWLTGGSEDAQRFIDTGGQRGLDIADQFNTMQARLLQASRMGGMGGGLGGVLPPGFYGDQPRRPAGGRPTAVAVTEADEELGGQPLTPPVSGPSRPPTQLPRGPMQRRDPRQRRIPSRPAMPAPAAVAPISSPAQRRPDPPWVTRRAGGTAEDKAVFAQKDRLVSEIENITNIFRREGGTQPRFQLDIERLAAAKAELEALIAAYPWLQE